MSDSSPEDLSVSTDPGVTETAATVTPESTETKSTLDLVEEALNPANVEERSSPAANRSEEAKTDPNTGSEQATKDDNGELSDDEKRQYSPRAQERIRDLAARKNELTSEVERLSQQVEQLQPQVEQFNKLTGYLQEHGISSQEANNSLEITRLIKTGDYDKALQVLTPIYQELSKRAGGVLDEDLREDVRLGHIPIQRAQEIQRGRAQEANTRERQQVQQQREEQRQQAEAQQAQQRHVQSVARAADDWAKQKADSDPDWNQKQDLVAAQVSRIITSEGFPKTVEEAIKISERALEAVEKSIGAFRPKPRQIDPARPTGSASPRDPAPPATPLDAVNRALEQS